MLNVSSFCILAHLRRNKLLGVRFIGKWRIGDLKCVRMLHPNMQMVEDWCTDIAIPTGVNPHVHKLIQVLVFKKIQNLKPLLVFQLLGVQSIQPPLPSSMVLEICLRTNDLEIVKKSLPLLAKEHGFWNSGIHKVTIQDAQACTHTLNQYYAMWNKPRLESSTIVVEFFTPSAKELPLLDVGAEVSVSITYEFSLIESNPGTVQ
uniref:alpha,alpha-trehalase n=1 Tax=Nelumbo nucifera TaxID=4432 RepID=A0A822ZE47_NELNU|nr:TPA_asm: hypothetical protein HUJ06_001000 [Nelumbo nucifera]